MKKIAVLSKRAAAAVLALAVMGIVPVQGLTPVVLAAEGDKTAANTSLGTSSIGSPLQSDCYSSWRGSYVYYGKYDGEPVKYRVLAPSTTDFGGTTMLLDCDSILKLEYFRENAPVGETGIYLSGANDWAESSLKDWLNGDFTNNFTSAELNAIFGSVKSEKSSADGNGCNGAARTLTYAPLTGEKIFALDAVEATNTSYGYANSENIDKARMKPKRTDWSNIETGWWLRSSTSYGYANAGCMAYSGWINIDEVTANYYTGVSPAFNIDLSSVLYATEVGTGEYKLTVFDSSKEVNITGTASQTGSTVTIPYTASGEYDQLTVMATDKEYTESGAQLLYLGTMSGSTFDASAMLSAVSGDWGDDYHVYLIAEDINGTHETDTASEPAEISAPAVRQPAPAKPSVDINIAFGGKTVTFNSDTEDAEIYYQTGSSNITLDSASVSSGESVFFNEPMTGADAAIYFKAYKDGQWSPVGKWGLLNVEIAKPLIAQSGPKSADTFKVYTQTKNSYIVYTLDGSDPKIEEGIQKLTVTNGRIVWGTSEVIKVPKGRTIKAIAIRSGLVTSEIMEYTNE